jgi:hypothetical protein
MTKYLVFRNQPDSGQVNEPGSREEMASEIANVVSQDRMLPNYYIAFQKFLSSHLKSWPSSQ